VTIAAPRTATPANPGSAHAEVPPTRPASSRMQETLDLQRLAFLRDGFPSVGTRQDRIARLELLILENGDDLAEAMRVDFGSRPKELSALSDLLGTASDLAYQRKNVEAWMKPRRPGTLVSKLAFRAEVRPTPKGIVGVMGPWNFPVNLVASPAGAAFAAGNRVLIRPSELTIETTALFARLVDQYFSVEEAAVFTDADGDGAEFSQLRVDHMFFTGSPRVGSLVAATAGANLVPVTLELGGKNPVVVDRSTNISIAAQRIADSRLINGGQVCMCPDYVMVPREEVEAFVDALLRRWSTTCTTILDNPSVTSIIDERNFDRIVGLIDDAVRLGATKLEYSPPDEQLPDRGSRKFAPTVLLGVDDTMQIAQEEVFGPVLSVHPYDDLDDAIGHIAAKEHPLTMYWYGEPNDRFERLAAGTFSGSISGNDFAVMFANHDLPFGGVGNSGSGAYHGRYGFDTFSHHRPIAFTRSPIAAAGLLTPPFSRTTNRLIDLQTRAGIRKARRATTTKVSGP